MHAAELTSEAGKEKLGVVEGVRSKGSPVPPVALVVGLLLVQFPVRLFVCLRLFVCVCGCVLYVWLCVVCVVVCVCVCV